MWKHLVSLYVAAIQFPVAAIKYYSQSGMSTSFADATIILTLIYN
jgi:hypothetical protein